MTNKEAKRAFMSVALVSMHDAYEALEDADTVDEAAKNKDNVLTIFIIAIQKKYKAVDKGGKIEA